MIIVTYYYYFNKQWSVTTSQHFKAFSITETNILQIIEQKQNKIVALLLFFCSEKKLQVTTNNSSYGYRLNFKMRVQTYAVLQTNVPILSLYTMLQVGEKKVDMKLITFFVAEAGKFSIIRYRHRNRNNRHPLSFDVCILLLTIEQQHISIQYALYTLQRLHHPHPLSPTLL